MPFDWRPGDFGMKKPVLASYQLVPINSICMFETAQNGSIDSLVVNFEVSHGPFTRHLTDPRVARDLERVWEALHSARQYNYREEFWLKVQAGRPNEWDMILDFNWPGTSLPQPTAPRPLRPVWRTGQDTYPSEATVAAFPTLEDWLHYVLPRVKANAASLWLIPADLYHPIHRGIPIAGSLLTRLDRALNWKTLAVKVGPLYWLEINRAVWKALDENHIERFHITGHGNNWALYKIGPYGQRLTPSNYEAFTAARKAAAKEVLNNG